MAEWKTDAVVLRSLLKEKEAELDSISKSFSANTTFNSSELDMFDGRLLTILERYKEHFDKLMKVVQNKPAAEKLANTDADYDNEEAVQDKANEIKRTILALRKSGPSQPDTSLALTINKLLERITILENKEVKPNPDIDFGSSLLKAKYDMSFPEMSAICCVDAVAYDEWRANVESFLKTFPNLPPAVLLNHLKKSVAKAPRAANSIVGYRVGDDRAFETALSILDGNYKCTRRIMLQTLEHIIGLDKEVLKAKDLFKKCQIILDGFSNNLKSAKNQVRQELVEAGTAEPTEDQIFALIGRRWTTCLILRLLDTDVMKSVLPHITLERDKTPDYNELIVALSKIMDAGGPSTSQSSKVSNRVTVNWSCQENGIEHCLGCGPEEGDRHQTSFCSKFKALPVKERWSRVQSANRCRVCLNQRYMVCDCNASNYRCNGCGQHHNPLICKKINESGKNANAQANTQANSQAKVEKKVKRKPKKTVDKKNPPNDNSGAVSDYNECMYTMPTGETYYAPILGTAEVQVKPEKEGSKWHELRAFLDEGSMVNLIRRSDVLKLNLPTEKETLRISGFNQKDDQGQNVDTICWLELKPRKGVEVPKCLPTKMKFFVVDNLPAMLPNRWVKPEVVQLPMPMADSQWWVPRPVNLLISVVECSRFKSGQMIRYGETCYEETALGIVVRGGAECQAVVNYNHIYDAIKERNDEIEEIQLNLDKFFDYHESKAEPEELDDAEKHFRQTKIIDEQGTYHVQYPMVDDIQLGESRGMCIARNRRTFQRLSDEVRKQAYTVIRSYIEKGIWVKCERKWGHYNPITIVHKPSSKTTPIRICVDASARSGNGKSLNDNMLTGAKLQPDIDCQIQKLRKFVVAYAADVTAMYLNAVIHKEQQCLQRTVVIWDNQVVEEFDMTRVVFGTKAAPFLANRIFKDIAERYRESHPLGSKVIDTRTYIDDINDSCPTYKIAQKTIKETRDITGKHHFPLVKWVSNDPRALKGVPVEDTLEGMEKIPFSELSVKVLGLKWSVKDDHLTINIKPTQDQEVYTKREATGIIAAIYDPCGFLGPVTLAGKTILQEMWKHQGQKPQCDLKVSWDEELPPEINPTFKKWVKNLMILAELNIPRHLGYSMKVTCKILTFVDASNVGYGAVCYLWIKLENGKSFVNIIQSKSHVAALNRNYCPAKKPELSIPRLEMLAAVTGAQLEKRVRSALELPPETEGIFFSDSLVVLGQIYRPDVLRSPWVERRLKKIRSVSSPKQWYHIAGELNVCADNLSRGMMPEQLSEFWDIWVHGPLFVRQANIPLPDQNIEAKEEIRKQPKAVNWADVLGHIWNVNVHGPKVALPEDSSDHDDSSTSSDLENRQVVFSVVTPEKIDNDLIDKLSGCKTLSAAKRVIVQVSRACKLLCDQFSACGSDTAIQKPVFQYPTGLDMRKAEIVYLKMIQQEFFKDLLVQIKTQGSKLGIYRGKNPFIDENGLIRLRTRLQKNKDYEYANPILLPPLSKKQMLEMEKEGKFSVIRQIVHEGHLMTVHGGPSEIQSYVSRRFWVLNFRNTIRMIVHRCMRCAKARPKPIIQLMGDLPEERMDNISSPFSNIILDYAGPFEVISNRRASKRTGHDDTKSMKDKVFVMVIVCQSTNAIFIDVVADASANAFLASFTRFVNTRGPPKTIRSDNATCFVLAAKILVAANGKQAIALGLAKIEGYTAEWNVEWHFNPPRTPHFGGHAEVFVKMVKTKMKKALATKLPIMDLLTVLKKIEGALNSRPLISVGSKFDGDEYLTPAHFIMQRPAVGMPEIAPVKPDVTLRRRYEAQCTIIKDMWKIHKQYLMMLAHRAKWYSVESNLKINDLVLLLEDNNTNPLTWKVGVVTQLFPGKDGLVRVVEVRTANGTLKRGVHKLSRLPADLNH